ncbi:MAG: hypothetical protein COX07_02970 [Bacteroidetes bacterium CG23_combo_of_CG06-09_8_20_14_all_32_9]|nr:MAG: hypothetical protein COX07_02970 [Bacteroidetes bacterium CG23_combo_of_CG06-09_8_20_14_all_32_9]
MKQYVEQLIGDIRKATWKIIPPAKEWESVDLDNEGEIEDIAYSEQCIFGKKQPISVITGIEKELLPPPEKLNKKQQKMLAVELENLLHHFNLFPDFPKNLPDHLKYGFILGIWEKEYVPLSFGENHIEFCNYELENCPFTGYCNTCQKIQAELEDGKKSNFDISAESLLPTKEEIENFTHQQKKEKIKKTIKNKKPNKNHIPGIYNYCDYWCERCSFTNRCANFSLDQEFGFKNGENNLLNKTFWENLSLIFEATLELLSKKAKEYGINIDDEIDVSYDLENNRNHPLLKLSEEYASNSSDWLKNNNDFLNKKTNILISIDNKKGLKLTDAIEIIQWYNIFISAKLYRALSQLNEDRDDPIIIYDNNGSAKIALVAINRSIAAFGYIMQNITELEDDCLKFLLQLSKIKINIEKISPQAKNFIRPGLDE